MGIESSLKNNIRSIYVDTVEMVMNEKDDENEARLQAMEEIREQFGMDVSNRSLRRITNEFRKGSQGRELDFGVIRDFRKSEDYQGNIQQTEVDEEEAERVSEESIIGDLAEDGFIYNRETDTYVFRIPNSPSGRKVLAGTVIRSMKRAYSDIDKNDKTIQEIVENFPVTRQEFMAIKRIKNWTHGSMHYTEEEKLLAQEEDNKITEDSLAQEAVDMFDSRVRDKAENKQWRQIQRKARKWDEFEFHFLEKLQELIETNRPSYKTTSIHIPNKERNYAWVVTVFDLHIGRYGFADQVGKGYDIEKAKSLLKEKTEYLVGKIEDRGRPEEIVFLQGGDWYQIDNFDGQTTNKTNVEHQYSFPEIVDKGNELLISYVDMLRQISDVRILLTPGNHDKKLSYQASNYLEAWYRNCDDVIIKPEEKYKHRLYYSYGSTVMGASHGRDMRSSNADRVLMSECKEIWGRPNIRQGIYFVGDKHNEKTVQDDQSGILTYRVPSLASRDMYEYERAYRSRRALSSYILDEEYGIDGIEYAPVID